MALPVPLLIAFLIAALPPETWDPEVDSAAQAWWSAAGVVLATGAVSLLGAWRTRRWLAQGPLDWDAFARRYTAMRFASLGVLLGGYYWVTGPGRLSAWAESDALLSWYQSTRLGCLLVPYFAGALVRRMAFARVEHELRGPGTASWQRDARGAALLLVPLVGLLAFLDVLGSIGPLNRALTWYPSLTWVLLALPATALMLFGAPLLLRLAWPTRPIPPGRLRDGLEALCRQAGFRCRDLRLWETASPRLLNAAVTGLLPRWRTVFLTVPLLLRLSPEQRRAVLAHEIAHARRRHLVIYAVLGAGFIAWMLVAHDLAMRAWGADSAWYLLTLAVLALVYWGGWFGAVSRCFERQADLDGAETVGNPEAMAGALERVAEIAGQPRNRRQWRHGSIASRVAAVRAAGLDPVIGRQFVTRARIAAWSAPLLLLAGVVAMVPALRVEHALGRVQQAVELGEGGKHVRAVARAWFEAAKAVRPPDAHVYETWGRECEKLLVPAQAVIAYRAALELAKDARDRERLRQALEKLAGQG